jgi:hypothetical protein
MAGDAAEAQPRPPPESGQPHDSALLAAAKLRLSLRAALSEGSVDTAARDTDGEPVRLLTQPFRCPIQLGPFGVAGNSMSDTLLMPTDAAVCWCIAL